MEQAFMDRNDYPYRWFGFWKGTPEDALPSMDSFIDGDWEAADKELIIDYIEKAPCVMAGSAGHFQCSMCSEMMPRAAFYSDGKWLWPASLIHEMKQHHVRLPLSFEEWIRSRNYIPPEVVPTPVEELPWPT